MMDPRALWHLGICSLIGLCLAGCTLLVLPANSPAAPRPPQHFAHLGTCNLEDGTELLDCHLGYLTLGALNPAGDNAVVFLLWGAMGFDALEYVGPGKLVDPSEHFIIVLEPFGNGVSSSPSNSLRQAGKSFPVMSIRDMARHQKRALDEHFGLKKMHAVVGYSMGAMLTLDMAVSYPDFAEKFVAITGTPRLLPEEKKSWQRGIDFARAAEACRCVPPTMEWRGDRLLDQFIDPKLQAEIIARVRNGTFDFSVTLDRAFQFAAMTRHDVSAHTGGNMAKAAERVGNRLLMVVATDDVVISPEPAREFSRSGGARLFEVPGCGHYVFQCAPEKVYAAVGAYLRHNTHPSSINPSKVTRMTR